jgi:hypothetical protein
MSFNMSIIRALDIKRSWALTRMGLRERQARTVLSAYFHGTEMAATTPAGLQGLPGSVGLGALRLGTFAGGGLAAWNMIPWSNTLAIPAAGAAGIGAYTAVGRFPALAAKTPTGVALRTGVGLRAGSMAWQGLRSFRPGDYRL